MSQPRSVDVLILSWNGREHLETCLSALAKQTDPGVPWCIRVLDNGSWDDTVAWMKENHPEIALDASPVNLGFCGGVNRLVASSDADAVALLNNDTRPTGTWLAALVEALSQAPEDVAAVSGKIVDWQGDRLDFGQGVMTFDGHAFQLDYRRRLDRARVPAAGEPLLFACGGNMLIRRASFLAAGGFDDDYFAYLEDVDLGWRLWAGGERVVFAPDAVVHHRSMATSDLLGHDNRGFLFERNAFLTAYKNYEDGLWQQIMPAVLLASTHRSQTLLVQNNPGGEQLTFDPYAGMIANTAAPGATTATDASEPATSGPDPLPTPVVTLAPKAPGLLDKWRSYGTRELAKRGLRKAARGVLPRFVFDGSQGPETPCLVDGRTVAQLRSTTWVLSHLEQAAGKRAAVQQRRQRSDREIFERFPVYVVPTYPGDERLFGGSAFADWLPASLPRVEASLAEIMALGDDD